MELIGILNKVGSDLDKSSDMGHITLCTSAPEISGLEVVDSGLGNAPLISGRRRGEDELDELRIITAAK